MVISAPDLAQLDLAHDALPTDTAHHKPRDVRSLLAAYVVELQHRRISLAAVDARVCDQVVPDEGAIALGGLGLVAPDTPHFSVVKPLMSLGFVSGEARATPAMQVQTSGRPWWEIGPRLDLQASAALELFRAAYESARLGVLRGRRAIPLELVCAPTVFALGSRSTCVRPNVEVVERLRLAAASAGLHPRLPIRYRIDILSYGCTFTGERVLRDGDTVGVGDVMLRFEHVEG